MLKAILLDVDGTLATSDKRISPRTADALRRAQSGGVRIVLASGRTDHGLVRFADALNMAAHGGALVAYNGAKAIDYATKAVYFERSMTAEQGRRVLEHLKAFDVMPVVDHGSHMYTNDAYFTISHDGKPWQIVEYEARSNGYLIREEADLAAIVSWGPNKILTAGEPAYLAEHHSAIAAPFAGELSAMFTAPYYFEFTPLGVDKAAAISATFAAMGIDAADVAAFGDAQNDRSMLEWAGCGIAMGNAVDEVKEIADFVTRSCDDDGIAYALKTLYPQLVA